MTYDKKLPKIALGAWAWGNDNTFGGELSIDELRPIYDEAMDLGLNLWDTAFAYGMGTSEKVLGEFLKTTLRKITLYLPNSLPNVPTHNLKMQ